MRVVDTSAWLEWLSDSPLGRTVGRELPLPEAVTSISTRLAVQAAEIAKDHALPMADAIIYATAVDMGADLLTCDAHFAKLPRVVYVAKGTP